MKVLHLTLKKKWFDMIASGIKREEYREIKPYWRTRLFFDDNTPKPFTHVEFRNGYSADSPKMTVGIEEICTNTGRPEWGADPDILYYVIKLKETT